jgi:hypothetical protein
MLTAAFRTTDMTAQSKSLSRLIDTCTTLRRLIRRSTR